MLRFRLSGRDYFDYVNAKLRQMCHSYISYPINGLCKRIWKLCRIKVNARNLTCNGKRGANLSYIGIHLLARKCAQLTLIARAAEF
jgi:hypothetical protein